MPPVQILGRLATICKSGRLRKPCFVKQTPERENLKGGNPMKKFLSLVLALVMTMSLVTVSAGA